MDVMTKVPVREQDAKERATNFKEVCLGYNKEEAMAEASRCINCKNAQCVKGCPVSINIPGFIEQVKEGNFEKAYEIIGESSSLPAVCAQALPRRSRRYRLLQADAFLPQRTQAPHDQRSDAGLPRSKCVRAAARTSGFVPICRGESQLRAQVTYK